MPANRLPIFVLLFLVLAGAAFWAFAGRDANAPAPGPTPAMDGARGVADAATGSVGQAAIAGTAATTDASLERSAVTTPPASATANVPALVGKVVDATGNPVAGAELFAGPGSLMMAASGQFDFGALDPSDFEDLQPQRMGEVAKRQITETARATTANDGSFRIVPASAATSVWLRVAARGFALLDQTVARPGDHDVDVGSLRLVAGAVVRGRVIDRAGNPIAGATVTRLLDLEKMPMAQFGADMEESAKVEEVRFGDFARTDAAGNFELAHVPAGEFTLRARHPEHPTTKQDGSVGAGREVEVTVTMPTGCEIRGHVVDMPAADVKLRVVASRKPAASPVPNPMTSFLGDDPSEFLGDLGMAMGERQVDLGADGEFVLRGLWQDNYRLTLTQVGVGFAGASICSERVEVAAPAHGVQLRYEAGVTVKCVVVDNKTGAPIERLWVAQQMRGGGGFADFMPMQPGSQKAREYPNGAVTVPNLRPKAKQTLKLGVQAVGYEAFDREGIELPRVGVLDLGTIRLEPRPVVHVTVVALDNGAPVAGARVRLREKSASQRDRWMAMAGMAGRGGPGAATTDADGKCTLNAIPGGEAGIEVEHKQFAPFVGETLHFPADGATEFLARLATGGTVEVTVVDDGGKPIAEVSVEQSGPGGDTHSRKTGANGVVRFEHLSPGQHTVGLGGDGGMFARIAAAAAASGAGQAPAADPTAQTVDVTDHGTAAVRIVKAPTAKLHGVVRENGVPLAGARVVFVDAASPPEAAMAEQMMGGMLEQFGGKKGRSAKTDESGRFTLTELPDGAHSVRVTHKERARPSTIPVTLRNGDNSLDVELDMTTVRGVVKDPGGAVVGGARLSLRVVKDTPSDADDVQDAIGGMLPTGFGAGPTLKSEDDGTFTLRGVDPDTTLRVTATAKGFAPATRTFTAARGSADTVLELVLRPCGRIKVAAKGDSQFAAVRAHFVGGGDGDGPPPVMQMLRKGKATLDGLLPGQWEVELHDSDGEHKLTVTVVAGETAEATF